MKNVNLDDDKKVKDSELEEAAGGVSGAVAPNADDAKDIIQIKSPDTTDSHTCGSLW